MVEIIVLGCVCGFLASLIVIDRIIHKKAIDKLTDKLMARDFREYSAAKQAIEEEITKRMVPEKKDPLAFKI